MAVGPLSAIVGLHLGRARAVTTRDELFLLGLSLDAAGRRFGSGLGPFENKAAGHGLPHLVGRDVATGRELGGCVF